MSFKVGDIVEGKFSGRKILVNYICKLQCSFDGTILDSRNPEEIGQFQTGWSMDSFNLIQREEVQFEF